MTSCFPRRSAGEGRASELSESYAKISAVPPAFVWHTVCSRVSRIIQFAAWWEVATLQNDLYNRTAGVECEHEPGAHLPFTAPDFGR